MSHLDYNVCKSQARMAEEEGLMAVSETGRGRDSNSAVSVIYETILQSERGKTREPEGLGLGLHLAP